MNSTELDLNIWAELIDGSPWGYDKGRPRIYINGFGKSTKVYFYFPDHDDESLGGAVLAIQLADCGQPGAWYAGQKRKIASDQRIRKRLIALMILSNFGNGVFAIHWAKEVMAADYDDDGLDEHFDDLCNHLINGRHCDAKAILANIVEGEE